MTGGARGSGASAAARRSERGSGTVLVVGALGVIVVLAVAGLQLAAAATAAHRARAAADFAALAAATAIQEGQAQPCGRAAELASRNGARLSECTLGSAESVRVQVSTRAMVWWPGVPERAAASARAGPAEADRSSRGAG